MSLAEKRTLELILKYGNKPFRIQKSTERLVTPRILATSFLFRYLCGSLVDVVVCATGCCVWLFWLELDVDVAVEEFVLPRR